MTEEFLYFFAGSSLNLSAARFFCSQHLRRIRLWSFFSFGKPANQPTSHPARWSWLIVGWWIHGVAKSKKTSLWCDDGSVIYFIERWWTDRRTFKSYRAVRMTVAKEWQFDPTSTPATTADWLTISAAALRWMDSRRCPHCHRRLDVLL